MKKSDVIIIGAGASGLLASIVAARRGKSVVVVERHVKVGRKILATGNGRCNITNRDLDISNFHGNDSLFASFALSQFTYQQSIDFFADLGLPIVSKENGRCYPLSNQASSVSQLLEAEALRLGVEIVFEYEVSKISKKSTQFVVVDNENRSYQANALIMACGGKAAAKLSSDGLGYTLAKSLYHSIISTNPALVQLNLDEKFLHKTSGVKIEGSVSVIVNSKAKKTVRDDILLTNYGISGSAILDISREVGRALAKKERVNLRINLLPEFTFHLLYSLLEKKLQRDPQTKISMLLVGIINQKLILPLLQKQGLDVESSYNSLDAKKLKALVNTLLAWELSVKSARSFDYAETTAGGVDTSEIDAKTMQSKKVKNLYFTGEILDIDGDCGGYNLAWAWASGHLAASSL
jgi:predicted Rossmann fold flavoprotein